MGSFPLLSAAELDAARARWRQRAPGSAAAALHDNVERVLSEPVFHAPLQLGLTSNLFQVQNILLEASTAFALSGEERYLQPITRCLVDIADRETRRARLPNEVHRAFVVVALAVADELCGAAIGRERELLAQTVSDIVAELHAAGAREEWGDRIPKRNAWNHTAVAYAAIGCGGLLCRERDPRAEDWLNAALERVQLFFADGVTDAGMTREGLTYCGFVFRNLAPLLLACRNAGVWDYRSPTDNPHVERLRRVPRWYAIETFPGGSWLQAINDSNYSPRRAMCGFLPTFAALDPPLCGWVYEQLLGVRGDSSHGRDPSMAASSLFESVLWATSAPAEHDGAVESTQVLADPIVGYLAERVYEAPIPKGGGRGVWSGFSFNCGEYLGGIHDQSDNGSVTLFAGLVPLLIDSASANEPVEGSPSSSQGHNVVLVDGRGQVPAGGGSGCTARVVRAERHPQATVLTADLLQSYESRGYNPLAHAIRHCVFGKHPFTYLLIVDDFCRPKGAQAVYEQLFHTPPVVESDTAGQGVDLHIEFAGEQRQLSIRPLDEDATIQQTAFAQHNRELFAEHHVWRVQHIGGHVVMPTLLLPYAGAQPPQVQAAFDRAAGEVALRWRVDGVAGEDRLCFIPGSATAATFTRAGERTTAGAVLLGEELSGSEDAGRQGAGQQGAVDPLDESMLRRRRRLHRLLDSGETFAAEMQEQRHRLAGELLEQLVCIADLDPDAAVLELDCGRGALATALLHYLRYGTYVGMDRQAAAVDWCRQQLAPRNPRFHFEQLSSPTELPLRDESFDFVVLAGATAAASAEVKRVLRVGGAVFLSGSSGTAGPLAAEPGLTVVQPDVLVLRRE